MKKIIPSKRTENITYAIRDIVIASEKLKAHNLVIFSDEIYDRLMFDELTHIPIASLDDDVCMVTFNGISKNYLACGWRIGWGIITGNPERQKAR